MDESMSPTFIESSLYGTPQNKDGGPGSISRRATPPEVKSFTTLLP